MGAGVIDLVAGDWRAVAPSPRFECCLSGLNGTDAVIYAFQVD